MTVIYYIQNIIHYPNVCSLLHSQLNALLMTLIYVPWLDSFSSSSSESSV